MDLNKPIASGNTANIYLQDGKILKVWKEGFPDTEITYEAKKQAYAHARGLPVPKVIEMTSIAGKQALIMEYIEGPTLGDLAKENEARIEAYMDISIDIQQEIHRIEAADLEPMTEILKRQIKAASELTAKQQHRLLQKLQKMPVETRLCHGDFHLFNLLLSKNKVMIIDWITASAGNIRADVCRSYLLYLGVSEAAAELYLHLYCKKSGMKRDEIVEWMPIMAAARLSERVSDENNDRLMIFIEESGY